MGLLDSLGLDQVQGDPNAIPDGPYKGKVVKSEIAVVDAKNTVSHVLTLRVTEGPHKGAEKQRWYQLGKDPQRDGTPANKLVGFTPTMTDQQKTWYKKMWADLGGIPSADYEGTMPDISVLVDKDCEFGIKTADGYSNVSWINGPRNASPQATPTGTPAVTPAPVLPPQEQAAANML